MPDPTPPKVWRESSADGEDDDDLDDLDDVLASFNSPPPAKATASHTATQSRDVSGASSKPLIGDEADDEGDDEDFEASLVEGMESLLRQLAGENPPGPMPDRPMAGPSRPPLSATREIGTNSPDGLDGDEEDLDDDKIWQKAVEMMLSGEGMDALGIDPKSLSKSAPSQSPGPPIPPVPPGPAAPSSTSRDRQPAAGPSRTRQTQPSASAGDFDETIRRTMEQLKSAGKAGGPSGGMNGLDGLGEGDEATLAQLLASLGGDGLGGMGEGGDGDDLGGLLDGLMAQLMTREVLEEPMTELASKFPAYLESPPAGVTPAQLATYRSQSRIVSQIVETFHKPGFSDEKDGKEVARLVGQMQDLGGPPKEIMGDLPEGFEDLGALSGEDGCSIM